MIGDGVSRTGATATSLLSLASHPQVPVFPFYQWCNPCTTMAMEACDETHTRGEKKILLRRCEQAVLEDCLFWFIDVAANHPDISRRDVVKAEAYIDMIGKNKLSVDDICVVDNGHLAALLAYGLTYPVTMGHAPPATSMNGPDEYPFLQQLLVKLAAATGVAIPCSTGMQPFVDEAAERHNDGACTGAGASAGAGAGASAGAGAGASAGGDAGTGVGAGRRIGGVPLVPARGTSHHYKLHRRYSIGLHKQKLHCELMPAPCSCV